ncbi:MAG TPA: patatin-like phospholipase family protein [Burkholderiaceae bacterium]|nr:patatin-like phospholipase family protein [Burkholderiaceae bacterium]HQR70257.1 patatin-like phospholipase family protein [Burkholderiaceae bacterium]
MRTTPVTLALQGGGSHGAFTWGVLDQLLEDWRIDIAAISGASAGAMNAVALAYGHLLGGRDGARQALKDFWEAVSANAPPNFVPIDWPLTNDLQVKPTPAFSAYLSMVRFFAPYQLNPFDLNPLRNILAAQIDFDRLRAECKLDLFIAATRVSTGTLRLFRKRELTLDVLLASACLPALHSTVVIDGEGYWDGGLTANPPLHPLLHETGVRDVIAVLLHPCRWPDEPRTAGQISQRLTEISFGSAFFSELQGIALARRDAQRSLLAWGHLERRLRRLNLHVIDAPELMGTLDTVSKLNAQAPFLMALRDAGRQRAAAWLEANSAALGSRSTYDISRLLG